MTCLGVVTQMVRVSACHAESRGFKSHQSRYKLQMTEQEVQVLIDKAIDKHNKTATLISACIGSVLLFFYAHGVMEIVHRMES